MVERYWIYDDRTASRGTLHRASCGHCKDGLGRLGRRGRRKMGGRWIGPFDDYDSAYRKLQFLGRRRFKSCANCLDRDQAGR